MTDNTLYRPMVVGPAPVTEILGSLWLPNFYFPLDLKGARLIKGLLQYCDEVGLYTGTEEEIEAGINWLRDMIAQPLLTQEQVCGIPTAWGATFRGRTDEGQGRVLQVMQGEGLPEPEWEFRAIDTEQGRLLQFRHKEE